MGKFLLFSLFAFTAQSAQATSFFCKGKYPNYGTIVVAKDQAYPSRLPISQVVVIGENQPVLDLSGSYESPSSDLFSTHVYKVGGEGSQAMLTVAPFVPKPSGCTRAGCDHGSGSGRGGIIHANSEPSWEGCNHHSKLSCEEQLKLKTPLKKIWSGKLNLNDKIAELSCDQI